MDTWIKPFEMNQVVFCREAKEFVRISNGTCTLDHSSPEAFAASHKGHGCIFAPSEALALRVVGVRSNREPVVACTYRAVRPEDLEPAAQDSIPDFSKMKRTAFIGRV